MSDKHFVLDRDPFADEAVTRNLAPGADPGPFLDFHERADLREITNLAPIEVREIADADAHPQLYVRGNTLERG
jgi:hypothetical protein